MQRIFFSLAFSIITVCLVSAADLNNDLLMACRGGDFGQVKILVKQGADVNVRWEGGRTALILATIEERLEIVEFLLAEGAYAGVKDINGKTALDYAQFLGYNVIAEWIRSAPMTNQKVPDTFRQQNAPANTVSLNDTPSKIIRVDWNFRYLASIGTLSRYRKYKWKTRIINLESTPQIFNLVITGLKIDLANWQDRVTYLSKSRTAMDKKDNITIQPGQTISIEGTFVFNSLMYELEDLQAELIKVLQ